MPERPNSPERARAVLVVDDHEDTRDGVAELIRESGRLVFAAADGRQALAMLDGTEIPRPCFILLDWVMAPMDGAEFLRLLGARSDADHLPVMIVSGDHRVPPAVAPGVLGTLRKPFDVEELLTVLDAHG